LLDRAVEISAELELEDLDELIDVDRLEREGRKFLLGEAMNVLLDLIQRHAGKQDDRQASPMLLEIAEHVEPIHGGHVEVEQKPIDLSRLEVFDRGATVAGLEPSCLFTLRDEWRSMGLGDAADRIGARARLVEELLAEVPHDRLALRRLPQSRALVHGHCHQKAFDAFAPVMALLRRIPGLEVGTVESSCCGMAGSFGYEAEHYEVSRAMAELSLLPAVRKADADTLVVAGGTSCRHQIADLGARTALHPIRVLARALA